MVHSAINLPLTVHQESVVYWVLPVISTLSNQGHLTKITNTVVPAF